MRFSRSSHPFPAVPLLAALALLAGCQTTTELDDHGDVDVIRLSIGTQVVNVTAGGAQPSAITIPMGPTAVTAVFLEDDGDLVSLNPTEYEIRIVSQNTAFVTYTPTGSFAGTLTGVAAGAAVVTVALWHDDHADFGPHNLTITVQ